MYGKLGYDGGGILIISEGSNVEFICIDKIQ